MKLLMIADDLTGALDSAVKFSKKNMSVLVSPNYKSLGEKDILENDIIVVDIDSRHLTTNQSYEKVNEVLNFFDKYKPKIIFKKTDSALRGNIGAELSALLENTKYKELHFIPAYPDIDRVTKDGIHYIDGVKLNESIFSKDPFEPTLYSRISEIISYQSDIDTVETNEVLDKKDNKNIYIYDSTSNKEINEIIKELYNQDRISLIAGCAGVLGVLVEYLNFKEIQHPEIKKRDSLLVMAGSINPVTKKQVEYAINNGFKAVTINKDLISDDIFCWSSEDGENIINEILCFLKLKYNVVLHLDSLFNGVDLLTSEKRFKIVENMGKLANILLNSCTNFNILFTGGDTLRGYFKQSQSKALIPIDELLEGVVISKVLGVDQKLSILSKSGGIGEENTYVSINNIMKGEK